MIFRRTLLSEFAASAAAVISILLIVVVSAQIIRFLRVATSSFIPGEGILALVGFTVLAALPVILGGGLFVAVLLTLTRSYRDSEMVVWFASGLSLTAWIRPVFTFALPAVVVIAILTFFLYPWAAARLDQYQRQLESRDETALVQEGVFQESKRADWVYFVEGLDVESGSVRNVFVYSKLREGAATMMAERGRIDVHPNGDRFLVLLNGRRYQGTPGAPEYQIMDFEQVSLRIEPAEVRRAISPAKTRSTGELLEQRTPVNTAELVYRVGLPLSALVLVLLAIPLSFVNPRVGRSFNLLAAVFLYFVYTNCIAVSESLVATGKLSPWLAVVAVHGTMLALALFLFYRRLSVRPLLPRFS